MKTSDRNAILVFLALIVAGALFAYAGSQGGTLFNSIPVFALCVALTFLIQWIVFIPSYLRQTEKYFDLTGSLTYISIITIGLLLSGNYDVRALLLWALVVVWAVRLGTFLFRRIRRTGRDDRFDELKPSFIRFLNVWTVQALWVTFTMAAALEAITTTVRKGLDVFAVTGFIIWAIGFSLEVIADNQKSRFAADPANKDKFIAVGLWSRSRHPNYFGEILLWSGVAVIVVPMLAGLQWIVLISPLFVALLLARVSGVPLLEAKADRKWGGRADYEEYKKNTPVLIPKLR